MTTFLGIKNYLREVVKMGLDFSKMPKTQPEQTIINTEAVPTVTNEIQPVEQYDIVADRQQMNAELVNSKEVDALVSTIAIDDLETIVTFGSEAADEISKASDIVLNSVNLSQLDESSEMLKTLAKIMDKFDIEEIKEKPGLLNKWFGNSATQRSSLKRYSASIIQWERT